MGFSSARNHALSGPGQQRWRRPGGIYRNDDPERAGRLVGARGRDHVGVSQACTHPSRSARYKPPARVAPLAAMMRLVPPLRAPCDDVHF